MSRPLAQVGVVGAGLMGAGIALVTAHRAQLDVRIFDAVPERARAVHAHVQERLSGDASAAVVARVHPAASLAELARSDLIVEAVFESLPLKQSVLREVEALTRDDCILASNTSSLPIAQLARASRRPHAVVGMHYFSPVHRMPLLEVIVHPGTAPEVTETCVSLGRAQGKTPIVVRDSPGFYTSRILLAYLNEAVQLLAEGAGVAQVDGALEAFGFPVGPLRLLDEVGLDVAASVAAILHEAFGERARAPTLLDRLRADGRLGRKNGRGFYLYGGLHGGLHGAQRTVEPSVGALMAPARAASRPASGAPPDAAALTERVVLRMVNEAFRCLDEGVLQSEADGDLAARLGLSFPAQHGGPFHYARARGLPDVRERLRRWEETQGPGFAPAEFTSAAPSPSR